MRIETNEKLSEVVFGNGVRELRGNFEELLRETEEGQQVSYRCDAYRTTDQNATFEELHAETARQSEIAQAKTAAADALEYLENTDYQVIKAAELGVPLEDLYPGAHDERELARNTVRIYTELLGG